MCSRKRKSRKFILYVFVPVLLLPMSKNQRNILEKFRGKERKVTRAPRYQFWCKVVGRRKNKTSLIVPIVLNENRTYSNFAAIKIHWGGKICRSVCFQKKKKNRKINSSDPWNNFSQQLLSPNRNIIMTIIINVRLVPLNFHHVNVTISKRYYVLPVDIIWRYSFQTRDVYNYKFSVFPACKLSKYCYRFMIEIIIPRCW